MSFSNADEHKSREQLLREIIELRSDLAVIEERRRQEVLAALQKGDQKFRNVFDSISDPIFILDMQGQILEVNHIACQQLGYCRSELLQMTAMDIDTPEHACTVSDKIGQTQRADQFIFKTAHRCKDGSVLPVEINARKIHYEGQACVIGVVRDISKRRIVEEELRGAKELLEAHLANSPMAIIEFDPSYRVIRWAGTAEQIFGWKDDEIIGKAISEIKWVHDNDKASVSQVTDDMLSGRRPRNLNVNRNYRKDGSTIYCEWYNSAIYDNQGRLTSVLSQVLDVTGRRQAEEALRQSEERYRQLIENAPIGIATVAPDGQMMSSNPFFCKMLGYSKDELLTMTIEQITHPDDMPQEREMILRLKGDKLPFIQFEKRYLKKDGAHVWAQLVTSSIRNQKGETLFGFGMVVDITDRKQAEIALRQFNRTLEQQVNERTQLAEARAKQLQALAVELITAEENERRRFAHLLHDDLQQLLAAARMQLQAISVDMPSEPTLTYVAELLEESIDKSRLLSHELSPAVLQHPNIVSALKWLADQMKEKFGLEVRLESTGDPQVEYEHLRRFLFRAVQELLFNIVKHAGVKNARIGLSNSAGWLKITVDDHGKGFSAHSLDTSSHQAGFGLLSIQERARYMGGNLEIESAPGKGSRFTISVPLSLPDTPPAKGT